jgi:PAS domain-containing protein
VLLFAIHSGLTSPYSIGALGAGLAALASLVGLLAGGGLGGGGQDGARAEAERPPIPLPAAPPPRPAPQSAAAPPGPVPPPEPRRDAPRFEDAVESIPIGYIGLDADFVVRAVNGEALAILDNRDDSLLLDRHFGATQLGAAIYDGPRTSLAGRLLHEFALDMLRKSEEATDALASSDIAISKVFCPARRTADPRMISRSLW